MSVRLLSALLALLLAVAVAVAVAACGSEPEGDGGQPTAETADAAPIRIGSKNFTEQHILGELYSQALEAQGFPVALKSDIGSSEIVHQALTGGGIDMYPEYVGVLLSEIADEHERPRDAKAAYRRAKAFEERRGFTLLGMTPFSDSNALAVTPETARRHRLRAISGLARLPGGTVTVAAAPEFRTRYEGLLGLREVYGLDNVRVRSLQIGRQYDALRAGEVDVAAVFTTDGQLSQHRYVLLEDPRALFAAQHVAPVISQPVLAEHGPRLRQTVDAVSRRLTTEAMREMNAAVDLEGQAPKEVASRFLQAQDLV